MRAYGNGEDVLIKMDATLVRWRCVKVINLWLQLEKRYLVCFVTHCSRHLTGASCPPPPPPRSKNLGIANHSALNPISRVLNENFEVWAKD